jgi:hypothetical protein
MSGETEILAGGSAEAKQQGRAQHLECGGSPPPLAAGACPGVLPPRATALA